MATHSSILAWKIPWAEEPGGGPWGPKESDVTEHNHSYKNGWVQVRIYTSLLIHR